MITPVFSHRSPLLAAFLSLAACRSLPVPFYPDDPDPKWNKDRFETSYEYCSRVATKADAISQGYLGTGVALAIIASGLAVVGAAIGPSELDDANWAEENRNALLMGSAGILAIPTTVLLTRSRDTSIASADASSAMTPTNNQESMKKCLNARAGLARARGSVADTVKSDLTKRLEALQEQKKGAAEEKSKKEEQAEEASTADEKQRLLEEAQDAAVREKAAEDAILQTMTLMGPPPPPPRRKPGKDDANETPTPGPQAPIPDASE